MRKRFYRSKQVLKWLKQNKIKSRSKYTIKDKFLFKKIIFTNVKECYVVAYKEYEYKKRG